LRPARSQRTHRPESRRAHHRRTCLLTIAFPAISCGIYGYPRDEAAEVAVRTLAETLPECPEIEKVYLVAYDEEMYEFYEALIHELDT